MKPMVMILFYALSLVSAIYFTSSFFLHRVELKEKSSCKEVPIPPTSIWVPQKNTCWTSSPYDVLIWVVIDALRYDFVDVSEPILAASLRANHTSGMYLGKLNVLRETPLRYPTKSRLYKFVADPPTVTMQRLKSLTTGTMPTFLEAIYNFDSPAITEDNLVDQCLSNGFETVLLGDDTWIGLYPTQFQISHPFPSFNVRDLHTVDNGVLEHLENYIVRAQEKSAENGSRSFIVAHFLGVDHAGHMYGPQHSVMTEKLEQLNRELERLILVVEEKTLLVVLGDHGMTEDGNHGGTSVEEASSVLFIYSKRDLYSSLTYEKSVRQSSLLATLSIALGLPIPYGNLGMVIPDFFSTLEWLEWNCTLCQESRIRPMLQELWSRRLAAHSTMRYLESYIEISNAFSKSDAKEWKKMLDEAETSFRYCVEKIEAKDVPSALEALSSSISRFRVFHTNVLEECKRKWSTYDEKGMYIGSFTFLLVHAIIYIWKPTHWIPNVAEVLFMIYLLLGFGNSYIEKEGSVALFAAQVLLLVDYGIPSLRFWAEHKSFSPFIYTLGMVTILRVSTLRLVPSIFWYIGSAMFLRYLLWKERFSPLQNFLWFVQWSTVLLYDRNPEWVYLPWVVFIIFGLSLRPSIPTNSLFYMEVVLPLFALWTGRSYGSVVFCLMWILALDRWRWIRMRIRRRPPTVVYIALAHALFYVLGHTNEFGSLKNSTGFVGLMEFHSIWSPLFVICNTFASHILVGAYVISSSKEATKTYGMFVGWMLLRSMFMVIAQREHLMLWRIFAPKYALDFVCCIFLYSIALIGTLISSGRSSWTPTLP